MEWARYKIEFGPEGRARQIIIPNTSPADWQLWLDYLAATDVEIRYFVDGNPVSLPEDVREMLRPDGRLRALHIQPRGLSLTADLSTFDQIRLRFDPGRITDEDKARLLFHMMSTAGGGPREGRGAGRAGRCDDFSVSARAGCGVCGGYALNHAGCPGWFPGVRVRYAGSSRNLLIFAMKNVSELEKEVLELSHAERERLAIRVWRSLERDAEQGVSDPEGLALARQRDREIESGETAALSEEEFRRMTGGDSSGGQD